MKTYELNGRTIGVETLPKNTAECGVIMNRNGEQYFSCASSEAKITHELKLVGTGWQFLSLSKDMTEEQAKMIMPSKAFESRSFDGGITDDLLYKDYEFDSWDLSSALKSLRSWERSKGIVTVNPYHKPELQYYLSDSAFTHSDYEKELLQWSEAQQQVVQVVQLAYLIKG